MGFDNFFEHDDKHRKHQYSHNSEHDSYKHLRYQNFSHTDIKQVLLNKLRNNPSLKWIIIIGFCVVIFVIVLVAILIFPLIIKVLHYFTENGIQGVVDALWNGTKK